LDVLIVLIAQDFFNTSLCSTLLLFRENP
jgi:hypothetical protein